MLDMAQPASAPAAPAAVVVYPNGVGPPFDNDGPKPSGAIAVSGYNRSSKKSIRKYGMENLGSLALQHTTLCPSNTLRQP